MNGRGDAEVTPQRLAELVDGAPPLTDAERAMVGLMARTRALEPGAGAALRARVRERVAAGPPPRGGAEEWWDGLMSGPAWRRVAAPVAAAALIAGAVAIPSLTGGGGGDEPPAAAREVAPGAGDATRMSQAPAPDAANPGATASSAAEATAPPAADMSAAPGDPALPAAHDGPTLRLEVGSAAARAEAVTEATAAVRAAGGERIAVRVSGDGRVLTFAVPGQRGAAVLAALADLGAVEPERLRAARPGTGGDAGEGLGRVRLVVAVTPGG